MIIRGWHIDGFGVFRDRRTEGLGHGLTVLHGPNEAGKSTLLAFIRGVLFGFPDKRSKRKEPLYPPLHGGAHGGRLFLEHDGRAYTVARSASSRQAQPTITDDSGTRLPEGELTRLLGGADRTLFQTIFGFSLWELQELSTLTAENVRDRIFSGAVAGAGRSARQAAEALGKQATALYRPDGRHKANRVHELLQEMRRVDGELEAARAAARAYPDKLEAERRAHADVDALRAEIDRTRARKAELDRLVRLWETWCEREAALAQLETATGRRFPRAAAVTGDPALTDLQRRADDLRRHAELQRHRLADARERAEQVSQADERLSRALTALGEGWTRDAVAAFTDSIPHREDIRAWEQALQDAEARVVKASEAHETAAKQLAEARDQHRQLADELAAEPEPPPDLATLRARQDALERLGAEIGEDRDAERRAQNARDLATERAKRVADVADQQPGRAGFAVALALAALAAVAAGGGVWMGETLVGVGAAGAIAAAAIGLALWVARRRAALRDRLDHARGDQRAAQDAAVQAEQSRESTARTVRASATALGFDDVPSDSARVRALNAAREAMEQRRQYDAKRQALTEAANRVAARDADATATERALTAEREARDDLARRWAAWKRARGFPAHLSPQGVRDFGEQILAAQAALSEKTHAERALAGVRTAIDDWAAGARAVLGERNGDTTADGEALVHAFTAAADAIAAEQEAYARAMRADDAIHHEAGHDAARAADLRATLAAGDIDAWRAELAGLDDQLAHRREAYDSALAAARDATKDRETVEQSDRIAELDQERNRLADEIARCYRRWQVLGAAKGLIDETLEQFERERQPAVFANASARLGFFTQGRYQQIRQDAEGQGVVVVDRDQQQLAPLDLSRGTREQVYLAVRLGLIDEFMGRGTVLPLVMDEILVNFDPERMAAVARELGRFAQDHQVLLFTCHPEIAERVQANAPGSTAIAMSELARESIA
jgi:uncharacterized protein YhaN